jgi:hypothetical protein
MTAERHCAYHILLGPRGYDPYRHGAIIAPSDRVHRAAAIVKTHFPFESLAEVPFQAFRIDFDPFEFATFDLLTISIPGLPHGRPCACPGDHKTPRLHHRIPAGISASQFKTQPRPR